MAIQMKVTEAEYLAMAEGVRNLYVKDGDGYRLDVTGGEDVSGLKSALDKERNSRKELEKLLSDFKGLGKSPEEIKTIKSRLEAMEAEKLLSEGKYKELLDLEKQKAEETRKASEQKVANYKEQLQKILVDGEILKGLAEFGGTVDLLQPYIKSRIKVIEGENGENIVSVLDASGKTRFDTDGKPLTIHSFIEELRDTEGFSVAFKATNRGGSGSHGGKGAGGTNNPFAKETYNLTEQAKLFKKDPERARQLAREAGVII